MDSKLISVIVPVYNTEKYLEKCLDSVCNQTYKNLEIIIINDGSTDNSQKIIDSYLKRDSRIKTFYQKNQGLSETRNKGMDVANGEYIAFVDSDDWMDTDTFEKAIEFAVDYQADVIMWPYKREYPNKSKETMLFNEKFIIWDENNVIRLYRKFVGLVDEELSEPQKIDSLVTAWGKLYRKDIINNYRFINTKEIGTEDALFNIQIFSSVKKAIYFSDCFSHYRKENENSLTHSYKKELITQWINLYKRIEKHLKDTNSGEKFYIALRNRVCLGLIGLCLNLSEDKKLTYKEKYKELKNILSFSHYIKALSYFEISYLPIYWKVFYLCLKRRLIFLTLLLLKIMNKLRGV